MTDAIRLEALPARHGDCLLVECVRSGRRPWRMVVDGGPRGTTARLTARLERIAARNRVIDAFVVTHIDSDHIGGAVAFLQTDLARAAIRDVWFNGRKHLPPTVVRGVAEAERVTEILEGRAGGPALPWNVAVDGGAFVAGASGAPRVVELAGGPRLSLLSPTTPALAKLGQEWRQVVREADRDPVPTREPDLPGPLGDLAALAATGGAEDDKAANGSSIALLLEHRGASLLLAGDATPAVLVPALAMLARERGSERLTVDAVKLPHHGSRANVTRALVAAVSARHYVVSSNGDHFRHPDDAALARVVTGAPRGATLWFNYRTPRTGRWEAPALRAAYGYRTRYPSGPEGGIALRLPAR